MKTFYTLTDHDTTLTNSRSVRYSTLEAAQAAATKRLIQHAENGDIHYKGCYIMQATVFMGPTVMDLKPEQ